MKRSFASQTCSKEISDLEFEDIENFLGSEISEGYHLDFKEKIGNPDKVKKEITKYVSSFANSSGGYILYGISNDLKIRGVEREVNGKK